MTPRKPDRFERMVEKLSWLAANPGDHAPDYAIFSEYAIKLLRSEHAWTVRMVEREFCTDHAASSQKIIGWNQAIECILYKLNRRRLGKEAR